MSEGISEAKIEPFLLGNGEKYGFAEPGGLKNFLSNVSGRVTLNPATHECQINTALLSICG